MYFLAIHNPFFQAYLRSDFFGKMVFFSLFVLSIASWSILIYKIWMLSKIKKLCSDFEKVFHENKENPLAIPDNFAPKSDLLKTPYLEIYKTVKGKTFEVLNKNRFFLKKEPNKEPLIYLSNADIEMLETHAYFSISRECKFIEKNLFVLPTITSLGPFLGLLGTVWGILITFTDLHEKISLNTNQTFLSGLSMALATTVLGLLVAIPALISHNYLKARVIDIKKDMENFSHHLLTTIEMQYRDTKPPL